MLRRGASSGKRRVAQVGLGAGLEGEGQHREEEDRGEGGEGGEAFLGVAAHGERVARAAGGRKGLGSLSTQDRGARRRDFKGLAVGFRGVLRVVGVVGIRRVGRLMPNFGHKGARNQASDTSLLKICIGTPSAFTCNKEW
jgi:hypothetical protein